MEASSVIAAMSDLKTAAVKHLARNAVTPDVVDDLRLAARRCAANLLANDSQLRQHFTPDVLEGMLLRLIDEVVSAAKQAA